MTSFRTISLSLIAVKLLLLLCYVVCIYAAELAWSPEFYAHSAWVYLSLTTILMGHILDYLKPPDILCITFLLSYVFLSLSFTLSLMKGRLPS